MFNAERVLGSLLSSITGSNNNVLGGLLGGKNSNKAAIGMGAIGLAVAAYEHFSNSQSAGSATQANRPSQPTQPQTHQASPPPMNTPSASAPPPPGAASSTATPPSAASSAPAAAPPPPPGSDTSAQQSSLLLIQAMIAAANADGFIDEKEKSNILKNLERAGSDAEGINYFHQLLANPPGLGDIVSQVNNNELAQQIYMVSLLTIHVDTSEEQRYLDDLAAQIGLNIEQIQQLELQFKQ